MQCKIPRAVVAASSAIDFSSWSYFSLIIGLSHCSVPESSLKAWFLNLGTRDIQGWIILCCLVHSSI
jgi:hypothetical protein